VATTFKYHQRPSIAVKIEQKRLASGGSVPDPAGGAYSTPQAPISWEGLAAPSPKTLSLPRSQSVTLRASDSGPSGLFSLLPLK